MSEVKTVENMVNITIDGIEYKAKEGEYILNAARANNVFIPAICYLTRCSPTLACRICLVEADGKQVYSCNAKVKEGMEVVIDTPNILQERRAIMEVYDVNHPLQCGVCDKSGECELQNYTLEMGVDSQSYMIPDTKRETTNWSSVLHYDAGLCIVCERCTTVCKDMIGDAAITTTKRGGEMVAKEYKTSMPKDAYSMWNKLQKSVIAPSNGTGETNCSDCGECIAVCPVGALASRDFVYQSNAWDLKRVPAVAAHSSDGAQIYYEVKPTSIENREEKIYRITNEWSYVSLDGSARFAYDFQNRTATKDEGAFANAIEAFKKAQTVRFNSMITNEEAMMLQSLKEEMGIKLFNPEVKAFQNFLGYYQEATGQSLWSGDTDSMMKKSDFIISIGASLRNDSPAMKYAFNNIQKLNKGAGLYFHPVGDTLIPSFGKSVMSFEHPVGLEEAALYLVLDLFGDRERLSDEVINYIDSFKREEKETIKEKKVTTVKEMVKDEETGEEKEVSKRVTEMVEKEITVTRNGLVEMLGGDVKSFEAEFEKMMKKKTTFSMLLGEDLYYHENAQNIAKLVALVEASCGIDVVIQPPKSNALGVALICDLDEAQEGYTIGYNEKGDFRLCALGNGDLDMPAMNQQEGTLCNIGKRLLPTNAAVAYGGYELNDIVDALIGAPEYAIDWTASLPSDKGFRGVAFDDLTNSFDNDGSDNRGYCLEVSTQEVETPTVEEFDASKALQGEIAYRCNPARQFNDFTDKSHEIFEAFGLYASEQKAQELGQRVEVVFEGGSITLDVIADPKITGDIVKISDFRASEGVYDLFGASRYANVTLRKV
jgi:NADH-quinone oxidoreductase subunit G